MEEKLKTGGLLYMIMIAYRNIYRNKRRTILCIVAIGISVFVIVGMMGLINGMVESSVKTIQVFETGHIQIGTKDYYTKEEFKPVFYPLEVDGILIDFIDEISKIKGVKYVSPRIASFATFVDSKVKHGVIWGIDTEKEFKNNIFNLKNKSNGLLEGRYPIESENTCAIGERLAKKMGLKIGDKVQMKVISSQFSDKFFNPVIVGIFDYDYIATDENYVIVPFDRLQKVLTLKNKTQEIMVYLNDYNKASEIKKEILTKIEKDDIKIRMWSEHYYMVMLKQISIMYIIMYLVFIIVSSFLIINTVLMMIHERMKEIGMMGSLGMTRFEIVEVIFFEAVFLSLFGSLFGALMGGALNLVISNYPIDLVSMSGGMDMPMGNTLFVKSSFEYIFKGFLFGVVISSLCTIIPSLKAAFIAPVEALRR
ncbi:MAG TPA: ABC transporter permease [Spirochaetota bacterium]|nr:ABC transporter permease [Spirochaetota bacterium]